MSAPTATSEDRPPTNPRVRLFDSEHLVLWLTVAYFVVLVPFTPDLARPGNLTNLLITLLPLFVVAIGQTLVLITGGIDLSATSIMALASVLGGMAMNDGNGWLAGSALAAPAGVVLMLGVGALIGGLNGLAVVALRMPPFIVTLTTMMFFSGLAIWLTQSKSINGLPPAFNALGGNTLLALSITTFVALLAHAFLSRSLWGRWLYAVGGNPRTARVSGVPAGSVTASAYVVGGVFAAVGAILYTGQGETASPVLGQRLLLDEQVTGTADVQP